MLGLPRGVFLCRFFCAVTCCHCRNRLAGLRLNRGRVELCCWPAEHQGPRAPDRARCARTQPPGLRPALGVQLDRPRRDKARAPARPIATAHQTAGSCWSDRQRQRPARPNRAAKYVRSRRRRLIVPAGRGHRRRACAPPCWSDGCQGGPPQSREHRRLARPPAPPSVQPPQERQPQAEQDRQPPRSKADM